MGATVAKRKASEQAVVIRPRFFRIAVVSSIAVDSEILIRKAMWHSCGKFELDFFEENVIEHVQCRIEFSHV